MTDIKTSINRLENYLNQKFDNIFVKFISSFNKDINFFEYPVFVDKDLIYSIDTLNTFVDDAILRIYKNLEYNFEEKEMNVIKKCIIIGGGSDPNPLYYTLNSLSFQVPHWYYTFG